MDQLTERLLRLLADEHGWQRTLLVVQDADGRVGWLKEPEDLPLSVRLNTDDTVSVTLGHRRRRRRVSGRAGDAGGGDRGAAQQFQHTGI